jgi:hypothetical protein
MSKEIEQSILEVIRAIENLNRAFAKRADDLKKSGNANELQEWMKAVYAMQDSGNIYMNWAKHYARTAGVKTNSGGSEESDFVDEESVWPPEQNSGP